MSDDLYADSPGQEPLSETFVHSRAPGDDETVLSLIQRVVDLVNSAKTMPLSSSVLIARDEVLDLLEEAQQRLPDEIRQARWLLKERDEFLERTHREAEEILSSARARAAQMVERTEIVRQAQVAARRTLDEARAEALRLRHEAEDFCDQKLAAFEIVLDRTFKTVKAGRDKLKVTPAPMEASFPEADDADETGSSDDARRAEVFFDQDEA
jgi:cell division septum initiation protein DivIVA